MSTLPWDQDPTHPDAGWRVKTTVEKSAIPTAGSGRYVQEDVPKGAVIRETMPRQRFQHWMQAAPRNDRAVPQPGGAA